MSNFEPVLLISKFRYTCIITPQCGRSKANQSLHILVPPPNLASTINYPYNLPWVALVVVLAVEDSQNRQEQVQNVQVETDGCRNLLLNVVVADNELGVHQDVSREDQRSDDAVAELDSGRLREESGHEAEDDENPECAEEVRHPACEVVLGLAGKERKGDEDGEGENECLEHDPGLEHAGDDRDAVCFECGEGCEEGEVHRLDGVLVAGWYTGILESLVYLHSSCASSM